MMRAVSHASPPRLGIGCRVRNAENGEVLLLPEGILQLKGTATEIIQLCHGERTVANMLQAIEALYSSADPRQIERETESFLDHRLERRAVDFP